jgi:hypothetical protein
VASARPSARSTDHWARNPINELFMVIRLALEMGARVTGGISVVPSRVKF